MALAQYRKSGCDDRSFWTEQWSAVSPKELLRGMKYYDEYPLCLEYLTKDMRVLDVGCGLGQYVMSLSLAGYNAYGMDYSIGSLARCRKNFADLRVIGGDNRSIPFRDGTFEAVLSFGVVEHFVEGPHDSLGEINRVLSDNGLLILSVPYCNILRKIKYNLACLKRLPADASAANGEEQFHQYLFLRKEVREFVEDAGFEVVRMSRAYYQTLLFEVDFIRNFKDGIFKALKRRKGAPPEEPALDPGPATSGEGFKPALKKTIAYILNMITPHFLIVVCRKN